MERYCAIFSAPDVLGHPLAIRLPSALIEPAFVERGCLRCALSPGLRGSWQRLTGDHANLAVWLGRLLSRLSLVRLLCLRGLYQIFLTPPYKIGGFLLPPFLQQHGLPLLFLSLFGQTGFSPQT